MRDTQGAEQAVKHLRYSEYELTDEHMRALIGSSVYPDLASLRQSHFDAWLAAHDRRVATNAAFNAWEEGYEAHRESLDYMAHTPNPYAT